MDLEVISNEFLGSADLTRAQTFCIYELTEVIMVNKDKNHIFAVFQVVAPSLKSLNDSQELLIMSLISSLNKDHLLKEKDYWISLTNFRFRRNWI